jgi:hypothetical protein
MIDLLWTGIGAIAGGGLGVAGGWAAKRWRPYAPLRRYAALAGALAGGVLGAVVATPPSLAAQLEAAGPAVKVLRRYHPGVFAQLAVAVKGSDIRDGVTLQNQVRPLVAGLLAEHRREMDDESATALAQLMLAETDALKAASPEACVAIMTGEPVSADVRNLVSSELREMDAKVTAQLIRQEATAPQPPSPKLSDEEMQRLNAYALDKLTSGEREAVQPLLAQGRQPNGAREAAGFCAFQRARIAAAIDAPAGTLRRFLTN